jgi:hypothetical protein
VTRSKCFIIYIFNEFITFFGTSQLLVSNRNCVKLTTFCCTFVNARFLDLQFLHVNVAEAVNLAASHFGGGRGWVQSQARPDGGLCCIKWHWYRLFFKYCIFRMSLSFHPRSIPIHSSVTDTVQCWELVLPLNHAHKKGHTCFNIQEVMISVTTNA